MLSWERVVSDFMMSRFPMYFSLLKVTPLARSDWENLEISMVGFGSGSLVGGEKVLKRVEKRLYRTCI